MKFFYVLLFKIYKKINFKINRIYHEWFIFNIDDTEKIFEKIYINNYWGSNKSRSGPGSSLKNTKNIRKNLIKIIKKYKIKFIFDAPCGDFNWMYLVIKNSKLNYLGSDIVKDLIKLNKIKYKSKNIKFSKKNLISGKFPKADLWIGRAFFYHLSFNDIRKVLINLKKSKIKYCLITNHRVNSKHLNKDITTGSFRRLSLFKEPLNFKKNYLLKVKDTYFQNINLVDEEIILWKTKDLLKNLSFLKK